MTQDLISLVYLMSYIPATDDSLLKFLYPTKKKKKKFTCSDCWELSYNVRILGWTDSAIRHKPRRRPRLANRSRKKLLKPIMKKQKLKAIRLQQIYRKNICASYYTETVLSVEFWIGWLYPAKRINSSNKEKGVLHMMQNHPRVKLQFWRPELCRVIFITITPTYTQIRKVLLVRDTSMGHIDQFANYFYLKYMLGYKY